MQVLGSRVYLGGRGVGRLCAGGVLGLVRVRVRVRVWVGVSHPAMRDHSELLVSRVVNLHVVRPPIDPGGRVGHTRHRLHLARIRGGARGRCRAWVRDRVRARARVQGTGYRVQGTR